MIFLAAIAALYKTMSSVGLSVCVNSNSLANPILNLLDPSIQNFVAATKIPLGGVLTLFSDQSINFQCLGWTFGLNSCF